MRVTIEIPDAVLEKARSVARAAGTSVESLVVAGLRREIEGCSQSQSFRLRDTSFGGRGLQRDLAEATWEQICEKLYDGRGT